MPSSLGCTEGSYSNTADVDDEVQEVTLHGLNAALGHCKVWAVLTQPCHISGFCTMTVLAHLRSALTLRFS